MFCGLQCTPYERLIDIAERNTSLHKIGDSLRIVPAIVPDFHHAWILNELPRQVLHILAVERRVLERDGKLNEQRAQPALACKRFKSSRASCSSSSFGRMLAAEVGSMMARGLWVKERCSFAVNMNFGFTAVARCTQSLAMCGLMCP